MERSTNLAVSAGVTMPGRTMWPVRVAHARAEHFRMVRIRRDPRRASVAAARALDA